MSARLEPGHPPVAPALQALQARIRRDLAIIAHPKMPWLEPRRTVDGSPILDVLIVGAGQSGIACAFGLKRSQVTNVLVVDKARRGEEGPWVTYARMRTLRSPKDYTGPDLDLPSLTYQSWHEARYGAEDWAALHLIRREDWNDYLLFVRDTVDIPVRNAVTVTDIAPHDCCLAVTLESGAGTERVFARKVVLATGQEGTGIWWMPHFVAALPAELRAHAADPIDFARLRGKIVAVLGAGASAFDNAAVALESGAAEVHLFCRRLEPQVIQPYRWLTFRGFLQHLSELDDSWRWRFMSHVLGLREGFPQETYDRCARHDNFVLHAGAPWLDAEARGERAAMRLPDGWFEADFLICGTGIDMHFEARPELGRFADNILTWRDRYDPPPGERDDRLAAFPYLDEGYAFLERRPGETPWLRDIHLFAIASTMSFGPSGSSINAMTTAIPKLVQGLTRGLFTADVERHWAALKAYDQPQAKVSKLVVGLEQ